MHVATVEPCPILTVKGMASHKNSLYNDLSLMPPRPWRREFCFLARSFFAPCRAWGKRSRRPVSGVLPVAWCGFKLGKWTPSLGCKSPWQMPPRTRSLSPPALYPTEALSRLESCQCSRSLQYHSGQTTFLLFVPLSWQRGGEIEIYEASSNWYHRR